MAQHSIHKERTSIQNQIWKLKQFSEQGIDKQRTLLDPTLKQMHWLPEMILQSAREKLESLNMQVRILSPQNTLKRGYSITRQDGILVKDHASLKKGSQIETETFKATITSKIQEIREHE